MRIAFLGDGSLNHVTRWVSYFHGRGHDVLLVSFENVSGCPFPAKRAAKRLPTKALGYLASLGEVRGLLADYRPQILNALYVGGYGLVGALSGHRPLVVSALGSDLLVDYPSSAFHRAQIRYTLRRADLVTTDAEILSAVAHDAGAARERIIKIYFGIDETVFHLPAAGGGSKQESAPAGQTPARSTPAETAHGKSAPAQSSPAETAHGASAPIVVSMRKLHALYNIDLLIEAAPGIVGATGARIIIGGEGPERRRLERLASERGVADRVTFTGRMRTEEIVATLQSASAYVSTSRSDSTSVSLLEAMACGAPPVVTDIPANREWIEDRANGLLFPPGDRGALERAVIAMITDSELARSARERNALLVRERGLWRDNMKRAEEAFLRLIAEGGSKSPRREQA